ncbi:MAG: hypothetical protein AAFZ04_01305 [Pseudomonadota bacterium]
MTDRFKRTVSTITGPATELHPITPDDGTNLPTAVRAIAVATSGAVRVTTVGGSDATVYVLAGAPFPVRVERVWATGTTATGIVGLI